MVFLPYVLDQIHLKLMMQWTIMHSVALARICAKAGGTEVLITGSSTKDMIVL